MKRTKVLVPKKLAPGARRAIQAVISRTTTNDKENSMTSRDFCYWLQGFFEISGGSSITPDQAKVVQQHLNMVFKHEIDPSFGGAETQKELNKTHSGGHIPGSTMIRC